MKKKTNDTRNKIYLFAVIALGIGFGMGFFGKPLVLPRLASAEEIEVAKNEVSELFKDRAVDACWVAYEESGFNGSAQKYELSYRNIRINKYANRAIVTDCTDYDTLVAKDKDGNWYETSVNLQLGNRVNPKWQKACLIEDITVTDDTIRWENSGIDSDNLELCEQLR